MPWARTEGKSTPEGEREPRSPLGILYGFIGIMIVIEAAMDISEGKGWVGARHLAMGLLFTLSAYKGPATWSSSSIGTRLLAVGAGLVYIVLYLMQVIVPLTRNWQGFN